MGIFTRSLEDKRKVRRVTVPVLVNEENIDQLEEIIVAAPSGFTAELTNISASSGLADVTVVYEGPNAEINHVKRLLTAGGLQFVTKRPKLDRDVEGSDG